MIKTPLLVFSVVGTACKKETDDRPENRETIDLITRDGVTLVGDYYGGTDARAMLLLHMIPPDNTRLDWPGSFITALNDDGWSVLAIDRRGAGESEGEAVEAYEGETGRYDVEASTLYLANHGAADIAIIGASNGTTSLLDYAAWAGDENRPEPFAVGFLSGGTYTETQTEMASLPPVPALFAYPSSEASWNEAQVDRDPGSWQWNEYDSSSHGTTLFESEEEFEADVVEFFHWVE